MAKAKQWDGIARFGLLAAGLIAVCVPAAQGLAQQSAAATPVPAAASTTAPAAASTPAANDPRVAKGRELFSSWGCTSCHAFADAQSHGDVGPRFDGADLTEAFIVSRVTNGQGAMPSFGGQLTEEEIADIAHYIVKVAKH